MSKEDHVLATKLQSSLGPSWGPQVASFVVRSLEAHPIIHAQIRATHMMGYQSSLVATIAQSGTDDNSMLSWYIANDYVRRHMTTTGADKKSVAILVMLPESTKYYVFTVPLEDVFFVATAEDLRKKFDEIDNDRELMSEALAVVKHNMQSIKSK